MGFSVTFNNISVISWRTILLVEETGENHDLSQVTDKLYHIMLVIYVCIIMIVQCLLNKMHTSIFIHGKGSMT